MDSFNWSKKEIEELTRLSDATARDSLKEKQYRRLCYLFEVAYVLAIEPCRNLSSNHGREWQLHLRILVKSRYIWYNNQIIKPLYSLTINEINSSA